MATKKRPGAAKRCARSARPYNRLFFVLVILTDAAVAAWAYLDNSGLVSPAIWGAVSILLKALNVAIHYLSRTQGSADDGESDDK